MTSKLANNPEFDYFNEKGIVSAIINGFTFTNSYGYEVNIDGLAGESHSGVYIDFVVDCALRSSRDFVGVSDPMIRMYMRNIVNLLAEFKI